MKTFTVYGGCVSRDVFNFLDNDIYKPVLTIEQNPVSTMFQRAIPIELEDLQHEREFIKRMLYYDANKLGLNKIMEQKSDWFIFDMICERITVMEIEFEGKIGSVVKTWPFVDNFLRLIKEEKYANLKKVRDIDVLDVENYGGLIDKFCQIILEKYPEDKIIFCEIELARKYVDRQGILHEFNSENGYNLISKYNNPDYANNVLQYVYKKIRKNLPNIHWISMPEYVIADEGHHFGLHPLHFTNDYYCYLATAIEMIVKMSTVSKQAEQTALMALCELQTKNNKIKMDRYQLI